MPSSMVGRRWQASSRGPAIATTCWMIARLQEPHGQHAGEFGVTAGFGPDDARQVLPVVVWAGLPDGLPAAACLDGPAFAAVHGREVSRRSAQVPMSRATPPPVPATVPQLQSDPGEIPSHSESSAAP